MNIKNLLMISLPALLLTLTACSSDDGDNNGLLSQREIKLTSRIGDAQETRAGGVNEYFIYNGSKVYIWADEVDKETGSIVDESEYAINAWELTANRAGGLEPDPSERKMFPEENGLNFYGFVGNFNGTPFTKNTTKFSELGTLTHHIAADQTTNEALAKSDLLFGQELGLAIGTYDAIIPFYHMLCQVQVALIAKANNEMDGTQADDIANKVTSVKLLDVPAMVSFTPAKLTDLRDDDQRTAMLNVSNSETQDISIPVVPNIYGSYYKFASAVIPPMTVNGNFIEIVFDGETFTIPLEKTFESGKSYRLSLFLENNATFSLSNLVVEDSWDLTTNQRRHTVELIY